MKINFFLLVRIFIRIFDIKNLFKQISILFANCFRIPPGLKGNGILGLMRVSTLGNVNLQQLIQMKDQVSQSVFQNPTNFPNRNQNLTSRKNLKNNLKEKTNFLNFGKQ